MRKLTICSNSSNDLFRVLVDNGFTCKRVDHALQAVNDAPDGGAVLILADGYPDALTHLTPDLFVKAQERKLRLFVEYPDTLPDRPVGKIQTIKYERAVISSNAFGAELPKLSILAFNSARYVDVEATHPHIVMARVAGFERAVYGLPKEDVAPILFELPGRHVLVATTKLSQFVTARYAPRESLQTMWQMVLKWLLPKETIPMLQWSPRVVASYTASDSLPADAAEHAARNGAEWFINARMLNDPQWAADNDVIGDGRHGVLEGISSKVLVDGTQPYATALRNDCCGEVAMALAMRAKIDDKSKYASAAVNVCNFVFGPTGFQLDPNNDPNSPTYGLMSWSSGSREVYFGDDNARSILGLIATGAALKDHRWDESLLRVILANFRTAGPVACQGHNLWEPLLFKFGWEHFWNNEQTRLAPHFESWLLACFLWLYGQTGFKPLLERTRAGIARMMEAYPHEWRWANGLQQERARMLLPLAWLVRVDDTPEHRAWLHRLAGDLLAAQDASGAICEELGDAGHGMYGPPKSNAMFGTNEAPLIHVNGEPVSDLFYTSNFALVSLTEAAAATGDPELTRAADRLADFIVRIQVTSPSLPTLDGAWFRAFDFHRWEHWGASADAGWGPFCVETGWTQAWIVTMLTLRHRKTSFWEFSANKRIGKLMDKVRPTLIPDRLLQQPEHSNGEPAKKNGKLDGPVRLQVFHDDLWGCYVGRDLEATLDLGRRRRVTQVSATCAYAPSRGLRLPQRVEFLVSTDGKSFKSVATVEPKGAKGDHMSSHTLSSPTAVTEARYVKLRAFKDEPDATKPKPKANSEAVQMPGGPTNKQWLFIDEVIVGCE